MAPFFTATDSRSHAALQLPDGGILFGGTSVGPDEDLLEKLRVDTDPDGWARRVILRDHIRRRQELRREGKEEAQPLNALDYLLAVDDVSRVGALRFRDEDGVFQSAQEEGRRTAPPLIELGHLLSASRAVESKGWRT